MGNQTPALSDLSDAELVCKCRDKKEGAWEELLARYRRKAFSISYQFVGKFDEAEDLTQEIFIKVFRSLDHFDPHGSFKQWFIRISKNHAIDHYRRKRKDREMLLEGSLSLDLAHSNTRSPYRSLELSERTQIFKKALAQLPDVLRTSLTMRELHGMSYQEIAERLDVPEGTVKSRINRARGEMKRIVDRLKKGKGG